MAGLRYEPVASHNELEQNAKKTTTGKAESGEIRGTTPPSEIMARRRAREARQREEERLHREWEILASQPALDTLPSAQMYGKAGASRGNSMQPQVTRNMKTATRGTASHAKSDDGATLPAERQSSRRSNDSSHVKPKTKDKPSTSADVGVAVEDYNEASYHEAASIPLQTNKDQRATPKEPPATNAQARVPRVQAQGTKETRGNASGDSRGVPDRDFPKSSTEKVRSNVSSFPHAFERWEKLSSRWEGLTSYWLRRLEQDKQSLDQDPLNQQMARQVTDLSAAGANLFHAVVELQRLRASSERKFQRWFFETRADQDRACKIQAHLEEQLRHERAKQPQEELDNVKSALLGKDEEIQATKRAQVVADAQIREMRRELMISRDEARRAWEELGRREQDERDRHRTLKEGRIAMVGGLQVMPVHASGRNPHHVADDPASGHVDDDQQRRIQEQSHQQSHQEPDARGVSSLPYETQHDRAPSDTDTDPFTENRRSSVEASPYHVGKTGSDSLPSGGNQSTIQYVPDAGASRSRIPVRTTTTTTTTFTGPTVTSSRNVSTSSNPYTSTTHAISGNPVGGPAMTLYTHADARLHGGSSSAMGYDLSRMSPPSEPSEGGRMDNLSSSMQQSRIRGLPDTNTFSTVNIANVPSGSSPRVTVTNRQSLGSKDSDESNLVEDLYGEQRSAQIYTTHPGPSSSNDRHYSSPERIVPHAMPSSTGRTSREDGLDHGEASIPSHHVHNGSISTIASTAELDRYSQQLHHQQLHQHQHHQQVHAEPSRTTEDSDQDQDHEHDDDGDDDDEDNLDDFEGGGYGGWENMPRHHHPTRLSDVLEEDEQSRASPSRASTRSRTMR